MLSRQSFLSSLSLLDSRAGAMGDAGVATSPDIFSMHWNPAKFAFIDGKSGAGISYSPWLRNLVPDINIAYLAGYYRVDQRQVVSGSLIYSSLGDVDFTNDMAILKEHSSQMNGLSMLPIQEYLPIIFRECVALRFIFKSDWRVLLQEAKQQSQVYHLLPIYQPYYHKDITLFGRDALMAFGANFSNIGSKMNYSDSKTSDFIPMNMRLGTAFSVDLDRYNKISVILDLNKLLVPTPPYYSMTKPDSIIAGKDPDVAVPVAIFQSFIDAPDGLMEDFA